jgi:antitoxin VapB
MRIIPVILLLFASCSLPRRTSRDVDASWYPEELLTLEERRLEAATKLERIQGFLKREKLAGVLITTVRNFSWITAGGDSHIIITSETGAVPLFIRDDGRKFIITSHSEAPRMQEEDLKEMGYELREIPWYGDRIEPNQLTSTLRELTEGRPFGSDCAYPDSRMVDSGLASLRVPLTDSEIRKYRWLGKKCAEAVERVCRQIQPGMTERGIEALVSDALLRHAIRPTVILIGADDRIMKYRHAPPSDKNRVEKYAMVNICARRWGLVISLTRLIHFGAVPAGLQKKLEAVARVNAGYWARTTVGASAGSILQGAIADYAEVGYPEEWRKHHQGGAIGYQERDWLAMPGSTQPVQSNQAFAWNPTIEGTKIEDTILLIGDKLEILTEIAGWPVVESKALGRIYRSPSILVR